MVYNKIELILKGVLKWSTLYSYTIKEYKFKKLLYCELNGD